MKEYNHLAIEKKWQDKWAKKKAYKALDNSKKKKFYALYEFNYPSGAGLHVGHVRTNTAMDIISRKRRAEGFNVLYPVGWDSFGLPTENYAIKTGISPQLATKQNTDNFRKQMKSIGYSFDWDREIDTSDPKYYKWTQWIFLQLLKHDLAYKAKMSINWCPKDKTGLANEEVINGCCERCGTPVEKREKEQWMLAITKYADRLDKDLDTVDYVEQIKVQQRNWIGKSEGAEINFPVDKHDIKIFTTRPDTIFGATFLAISPEVAKTWMEIGWKPRPEIFEYIKKELQERDTNSFEEKIKTGISAGFNAVNPATKEKIPVWIANYVLGDIGTGAIMGVPAHDERDFDFATKYNLGIKNVVVPNEIDKRNPPLSHKRSVERQQVHAIVRNPKTGKYLALKWKKFPWTTFVMGGIESGEDVVSAAKRELREETGFTNLKLISVLPGQTRSEYFATHKDENRIAYTKAVLFDLVDETRLEVSEKEREAHEIIWMDKSELTYQKMSHIEVEFWTKRMFDAISVYDGQGILVDSGKFSGMESEKAKSEIVKFVGGKMVTTYKLRDWVFSRQRYWGEPIPVIHCEKCGIVPLSEKDLPLKLPKIDKYEPTDDGESPLAKVTKWVNVKCPKCKGAARRETDTMPNWAGSSWYFLRYIDPKNNKKLADPKKLKYWMPVDWYNGGMEHTTLHLLYSRFWNKFLYDIGVVPYSEPYKKRTAHGLILAKGGVKMSKSKPETIVNPNDVIKMYGADTLRTYEMFMGPFDQAISWNEDNIFGVRRFLERVWRLGQEINFKTKQSDEKFETLLHKTVKKVSGDIETMAFNTAVSAMMILLNEMERQEKINKKDFEMFLKILSPFAPHMTEEIWSELGHKTLLVAEKWPKADPKKLRETEMNIAVQINNKVRAIAKMPIGSTQNEVLEYVRALPDVEKWLVGKEIKKIIFVQDKLINIILN